MQHIVLFQLKLVELLLIVSNNVLYGDSVQIISAEFYLEN